jgi:hypothetical protein
VVNSRKEMRLIGAVLRAEALGVVAEAIDGSKKPGFETSS